MITLRKSTQGKTNLERVPLPKAGVQTSLENLAYPQQKSLLVYPGQSWPVIPGQERSNPPERKLGAASQQPMARICAIRGVPAEGVVTQWKPSKLQMICTGEQALAECLRGTDARMNSSGCRFLVHRAGRCLSPAKAARSSRQPMVGAELHRTSHTHTTHT